MAAMGISGFGKRQRLSGPSTGGARGGFAAALQQSMRGGGRSGGAAAPAGAAQGAPQHDARRVAQAPPAATSAEDLEQGTLLPITHMAALRAHAKAVTALAADRTGSQIITGGMDYKVALWRFSGMTDSLRPFREHEPHEGYPVNDLSFSPNGDRYVASIDHRRPLIFSREGRELAEFVNGDVYVTQADKTRGHTASTTYAQWHPTEADLIATAGRDGTCRIWDPHTVTQRQKEVLSHFARTPGRPKAQCTYCGWAGPQVVTAGNDGRILIWDLRKGPQRKADLEISKAHAEQSAITCVAAAADGRQLASRSQDGTVKLWDLRKRAEPLAARGGLDCFYDGTTVAFASGDRVVATCTGADPRQGDRGRLVLLSARDLSVRHDLPVATGSCCKIVWSTAINQVLVSSQDGAVYIFYNPTSSQKGVLLSLARHKRIDITDLPLPERIFTPATQSIKEAFQEMRAVRTTTKPLQKRPTGKDAAKPGPEEKPLGRKAMMLRDFLPDEIAKQTMRATDPREALMRHAAAAEADPRFVDHLYKGQPRIFADPEEEDDSEKRKVSGDSMKKRLFSSLR
eukprot:TRINITY_DN50559_c0_g1_i1.p1 TRINITY_DN50559_c0_g1~~TRINITY_DN50559_c0_g1_i1.p1  ORF type:complete len:639 (+),score=213.55 TRINITY_DN50559_c0_g1_i1:206-1918(+)